ncbi:MULTISPECIES: PTS lactose/cellobiose transporter subunit IIA [Enterococcus]|uniref:PTS lactose/cellobiose transporter subunit IIA n=1 Tax=Enterococcus alishanensis TaxID=1303817 RepID=A0ABS6T901_9ENTE|nr:PTS lactose/cellobiose transporter subunit IIA [Enterococcus alishanensis]MBV7389377.1 PTS lactose/cellobiose transporter subunit IIA [Enterococcus alishanensis]
MAETVQVSTELESMAIILHAGNAKSSSYEALMAAKKSEFDLFDEKYTEAKQEIRLAHKAHAELLRKLSSSNQMKEVDLLLVHAEGHLSSTDIAVDLIGEFGELYKWKETIDG